MRNTASLALACSATAFVLGCSSSSGSSSNDQAMDGSTPAMHDSGSSDAHAGGGDSGGGTDGGAASTDSASPASDGSPLPGDGGDGDPLGPVPDGGELVQFVKADETTYFDKSQENTSTGTITFGQANAGASDDAVGALLRRGGEAEMNTAGAEEIVSNRTFSFGTFRFRLSLATCASSEEVVNGPFAYFNDGTLAPDGLVINREVDIEILCGEPYLINLTIWTEYTDDTHLKNQSRVVDMSKGVVDVYANDQEGNETGTESHPELLVPGWPEANTFYEMGWTWAPDHLRYFLVLGGQEVTLWDATDTTRLPQLPMEQHFNMWAPGIHWSTGNTAAVPANDTTLAIDWFRYDPQ
jgi:hypothetical protein